MQVQVILTCGFLVSFVVALFLARKCGSKAAKLEALKAELRREEKEQERAKKITDTVYNRPADDARKRLRQLAGKQR